MLRALSMRGFMRIVEQGDDPFDDPFTDDQKAAVPPSVVRRAIQLYGEVKSRPNRVGDTDVVDGFYIETHTLGCRDAADEPEENWWDSHHAIYDEFTNDGKSIVAGDPGEGVFVTITPLA